MRTLYSAGWSLALSAVLAAALVHPSHALVAPRGRGVWHAPCVASVP